MKRILGICLALLLLVGCASAQEAAQQSMHNVLTEVYSYTVEEADAFEMKVSEKDGYGLVECWPAEHPDWVYSARFDPNSGKMMEYFSPFKGGKAYYRYPGEGTVREGLRTARAEGWFTRWDEQARSAMSAWMVRQENFAPDAALQAGMATGSLSAGNALHAYFVSCYGEPAGWTGPLKAWHDEELDSYGLAWEPEAPPHEGVLSYSVQDTGAQTVSVVQFSGALPKELETVMNHPKLVGWTAVCGAYYDRAQAQEWQSDAGLIILEKEDRRLLVQMGRAAAEEEWKLAPVGEKALYQDQDVYITCDPATSLFSIVYPFSATEDESFQVVAGYGAESGEMSCHLRMHSRLNRLTGAGLHVEMSYGGVNVTASSETGETEQVFLEKAIHDDFSRMDVEALPTTLQGWRDLEDVRPPEGYGAVCGVHLRAQTSSRSKDLGTYHAGALVEILGEEDGDPYNWYRVRIGRMEGYMSSVYVDYEGSVCSMHPLTQYEALPVARALKQVRLKDGTGLFAQTVQELPAGTMMHVLAERGSWLHVMIPQGDIGWMMDVNGTDGYVRAEEVQLGASALQLEWNE